VPWQRPAQPATRLTTTANRTTNAASSALEVPYANWLDPATLGAASRLAALVTRRSFLTKFEGSVNPDQM
jgi:hypothetical protein